MDYFGSHSNDTLYHIKNDVQRNSANAKWQYEFSKVNDLTVKFSSSYLSQNLGTKFYAFDATQLIYFSEISYFHKLKKMDWVGGINMNGDIYKNKSVVLKEPNDYNYQTYGAFIQNTWLPLKKLTIEAGFRGDYHSSYGFFALPRLSLLYKFNKKFSARVNGGFGYKTPNIITYLNPETDLNSITSYAKLNPELSQGINADINFHKMFSDDLTITINQSFFFTNISRPVYDSSSTAARISLVNADKALQTRGLQTYARVQYKDIELYLGYVFTDVVQLYERLHQEPPVTPKHNFAATVLYKAGEHWNTGIESSLVGGQRDEHYNPVKNYFTFAFMLQYHAGKISVVLNTENLFDFRQSRYGKIYDGTLDNPAFHALWAPIDGRVINLSVKFAL